MKLWGKFVYGFSWLLVTALAKLIFRIRFEGRRHVPRHGPLIIASNHVSNLDPPLIGIAVPRKVRHMAKRELFKVGWLFAYMKSIGTIMVDRGHGKQALLDAVEALKAGDCVVIFPEGTRSPDGRLQKGHSGVIIMAVRAKSPIVPTVIFGSEKALAKGSKRIRSVPVTVRFGEPYNVVYDGDSESVPRDVLLRESIAVMSRVEALLPEEMRPSAEEKLAWYGRAE
jgi:1-acyl-sn-glycerol-3-phosphate acyltransferase